MKYISSAFVFAREVVTNPETAISLGLGVATSAVGSICLYYGDFNLDNVSTQLGGYLLAATAAPVSFILIETPRHPDRPSRISKMVSDKDNAPS